MQKTYTYNIIYIIHILIYTYIMKFKNMLYTMYTKSVTGNIIACSPFDWSSIC